MAMSNRLTGTHGGRESVHSSSLNIQKKFVIIDERIKAFCSRVKKCVALQGSKVKRQAAEKDCLKYTEALRDLLAEWRQSDDVTNIFGDGERFWRIRAALDEEVSESHKKADQWVGLRKEVDILEDVLKASGKWRPPANTVPTDIIYKNSNGENNARLPGVLVPGRTYYFAVEVVGCPPSSCRFHVEPSLPTGLYLNEKTGMICGAITGFDKGPRVNYNVTCSNAAGSCFRILRFSVGSGLLSQCKFDFTAKVLNVGLETNLEMELDGDATEIQISPALPRGLTIDPFFGDITGTPMKSSPDTTYTVMVSNASASVHTEFSLKVTPPKPSGIFYPNLPQDLNLGSCVYLVPEVHFGEKGEKRVKTSIWGKQFADSGLWVGTKWSRVRNACMTHLIAQGFVPEATYKITPELPAGLSISRKTGVITGSATAVTTRTVYNIECSNAAGTASVKANFGVKMKPPSMLKYPEFSSNVKVGDAVSWSPQVDGKPDTFSISPALPEGLKFDTNMGSISGIAAKYGSDTSYTITAKNAEGSCSTKIYFGVSEHLPRSLTYPKVENSYPCEMPLEILPEVDGVITKFEVVSEIPLPKGLELDPATGVIKGIPQEEVIENVYTIQGSNKAGGVKTNLVFKIESMGPRNLRYPHLDPKYVMGEPVMLKPEVVGEVTKWTISPGLPEGIGFRKKTGEIRGFAKVLVPKTTYTVTATNSKGKTTCDLTFFIDHTPPFGARYFPRHKLYIGKPIPLWTPTLQYSGGVDNWSIHPRLPEGLEIDPKNGTINGTPSGQSPFQVYHVEATNSAGKTETALRFKTAIKMDPPSGLRYPKVEAMYVGRKVVIEPASMNGQDVVFSVSQPLPPGLHLDNQTGAITGSPTRPARETTYMMNAYNGVGGCASPLTFGVRMPDSDTCETILTMADDSFEMPFFEYPESHEFLLYSPGFLKPENATSETTFSIEPALPDGLRLDPDTGVISGVPLEIMAPAGYRVMARKGCSLFWLDTALAVTCTKDSGVLVIDNVAARDELDLRCCLPADDDVTWEVEGKLPGDLVLDPNTGKIKGKLSKEVPCHDCKILARSKDDPRQVESVTLTTCSAQSEDGPKHTIVASRSPVQVRAFGDAEKFNYKADLRNVNLRQTVYASPSKLPPNAGNDVYYSTEDPLPKGLGLDCYTGVISGTAKVLTPEKNYTIIRSTGSSEESAVVPIAVIPAPILPDEYFAHPERALGMIVGQPVYLEHAEDVDEGTTFTVGRRLPKGLFLNEESGVISGSAEEPVEEGSWTITKRSPMGRKVYEAKMAISPGSDNYVVGTLDDKLPIDLGLTMTDGSTRPFEVEGVLPAGLHFDPATGRLTGSSPDWVPGTDIIIKVKDGSKTEMVKIFLMEIPTYDKNGEQLGNVVKIIATRGPILVQDLRLNASASGLRYPAEVTDLRVGQPVRLEPVVSAPTSQFMVNPPLPMGLVIDKDTGVISGIPLEFTDLQSHHVTAKQGTAYVSDSIKIGIVQGPGVYVAGSFEVGEPVAFQLDPETDLKDCVFDLEGDLPPGLDLNKHSGIIAGCAGVLPSSQKIKYTCNKNGKKQEAKTLNYTPTGSKRCYVLVEGGNLKVRLADPNVLYVGKRAELKVGGVDGLTGLQVRPQLPLGLKYDDSKNAIVGIPIEKTASKGYQLVDDKGETVSGVTFSVEDFMPSIQAMVAPDETAHLTLKRPGGERAKFKAKRPLPTGLILNSDTGTIDFEAVQDVVCELIELEMTKPDGKTETAEVVLHFVRAVTPDGQVGRDLRAVLVSGKLEFDLNMTKKKDPSFHYIMPDAFVERFPVVCKCIISKPVEGATFAAVDGKLPLGLEVDRATGDITGTPQERTDDFFASVAMVGPDGVTVDTFEFVIKIVQGPKYTIDNGFFVGEPVFLEPFTDGNDDNAVFKASPELPNGLALDEREGKLSGTMSATAPKRIFIVKAAGDSCDKYAGVCFNTPRCMKDPNAQDTDLHYNIGDRCFLGRPIQYGPICKGPLESSEFSVSPALPAGISLDATGTICGTPMKLAPITEYTVTCGSVNTSFKFEVTDGMKYTIEDGIFCGKHVKFPLAKIDEDRAIDINVEPALPRGMYIDNSGSLMGATLDVTPMKTYKVTVDSEGTKAWMELAFNVTKGKPPGGLAYCILEQPAVDMPSTFVPEIDGEGVEASNFQIFPALPPGLAIDKKTGVISGTPTEFRDLATYRVTADTADGRIWAVMSFYVTAGLCYPKLNDVDIIAGRSVFLEPSLKNFLGTYTVDPPLPDGLRLHLSTGVISGTPKAETEEQAYRVVATSFGGRKFAVDLMFGVSPDITDVQDLYLGEPVFLDLEMETTGDNTTFQIDKTLPKGLYLDSKKCAIAGTPSELADLTSYRITAAKGDSDDVEFVDLMFRVVEPHLPDEESGGIRYGIKGPIIVGEQVNLEPTVDGGVEPVSWEVEPKLPKGLSLDAETGDITGMAIRSTPVATYLVTAKVPDGKTLWTKLRFDVRHARPSIVGSRALIDQEDVFLSYPFSDSFFVGQQVNLTPNIEGGEAVNFKFDVKPDLPDGLILDPETGTISGRPRAVVPRQPYAIRAVASQSKTIVQVQFSVEHAFRYSFPAQLSVGDKVSIVPVLENGASGVFGIKPNLPPGLMLDAASGKIFGTPCTNQDLQQYRVDLQMDGATDFDDLSFSIKVKESKLSAAREQFLDRTSSYASILSGDNKQVQADTEWVKQLEECDNIDDLPPEPDKKIKLTNWMVWMVHRVHLNDPSLLVLDFTSLEMPLPHIEPTVSPKLMVALKHNNKLQQLVLSCSNLQSPQAKTLGEALTVNKTLEVVNIESNHLDPAALISLATSLSGLGEDTKVSALHLASQVGLPNVGRPVEQAMAEMLKNNTRITRLGLVAQDPTWGDQISRMLLRNGDFARRRRKGLPLVDAPKKAQGEFPDLAKVVVCGVPATAASDIFAANDHMAIIRMYLAENQVLPTNQQMQTFAKQKDKPVPFSKVGAIVTEGCQAVLKGATGLPVEIYNSAGHMKEGKLTSFTMKTVNDWTLEVDGGDKLLTAKSKKMITIGANDEFIGWVKL